MAGGAVGIAWLVLPGMTISTNVPVAISRDLPVTASAGTFVSAAAPEGEGGSDVSDTSDASVADLALPLVVLGAVGALAGYGYVRRTRRARTRTTPGGSAHPAHSASAAPTTPPVTDLDEQSRSLLTEADNWIRTSREDLDFAEARAGSTAVAPFAQALRDAESELSAAFRIRQQYDAGIPADKASRHHALAGIVGRCQEVGRRLDSEAPAFDRLRALEGQLAEALETAETRFRELAGRVGTTEVVLADLGRRYASSASAAVTGYPEQAKDRLVFATTHLNQARQASDRGEAERAANDLRAAEGAVSQATVLITGVDRLAAELEEAAALVPAALTGAEAEIADAGTRVTDMPPGEVRTTVLHANAVLAAVRVELTSGQPYDPLDSLRRIVRAVTPVATGRSGVLATAALCAARSTTTAAADFVTTHRAAVGATARLHLAEAERVLATGTPEDRPRADELAQRAREIAEQDVRTHGNPHAGADGHASGTAGAVLGGILLDGTSPASPAGSFGGPETRGRRGFSAT